MTDAFFCKHARQCGACSWLDVPYDEQLERKRQMLVDLFSGLESGQQVDIPPVVGMEDPRYYRNKMIVPIQPDKGGKLRFGMYAAGTHRVVPCDGCLVNTKTANRIVSDIALLAPRFKMTPYDEVRHRGWLRHVQVRESFSTGQAMVTLVVTDDRFPLTKPFVAELRRRHPQIATLCLNVNPRKTNVILGTKEKNLYGPGYITETLLGARFRLSSRSFFQTNPEQTEKLYAHAIQVAQVEGSGILLDAYCGTGTIGIIAAKDHDCQLIGVEESSDAVRDAKGNARRNGVENARFVAGDAGEFALELAQTGQQVDVVFVDPPRSGCSERFIEQVGTLAPKRISYISCNPKTQVRDIDLFAKQGYRLVSSQGFDLFPHTPHIENVCLLERGRV